MFGYGYQCTVTGRSVFAFSGGLDASDLLFGGIAVYCLLHGTVLRYVTEYPSVSVFSRDDA